MAAGSSSVQSTPSSVPKEINTGFVYLSDLHIRDLPTLTCNICYEDITVESSYKGRCNRAHFPSRSALMPA